MLGAIFELVGAVWCSSTVAATLANTLLPTLDTAPELDQQIMMLGTCLSAFSFILVSSIFGMPISGTHTVIGALVGAGFAGLSASEINWGKFGFTVASWFLSPLLSSAIAGVIFIFICAFTLGGGLIKSPYWRMTNITILSAFTLTFSCYMVVSLINFTPSTLFWATVLPSTFVFSFFFTRFILTLGAHKASTDKMSHSTFVRSIFEFWTFEFIISRQFSHSLCEQKQTYEKTLFGLVYLTDITQFAYRILLVQAACLVCLAHGSNDVANSIAPLLVELNLTGHSSEWAYALGGAGIATGLLTLGFIVIETVGKNVIIIDFYKGFSCQFATANSIILGTRCGLPLSTTHCMVGSLFGIVLCNKL